jgi:hypothetical protein
MAGKIAKSRRKANPLLTKNGRTRLGPLSLNQLNALVEKANRPKDKDKYQRAINNRTKKLQVA